MLDLFRQFWWLMFPVMGMVYGLVGMLQQNRRQNRAIDLLRTYAEQGKEPPPELLKALSQQGGGDAQDGFGLAASRNRVAGAWWTFFVFIALTAGFGVGASSFGDDAHSAFMVVTVIMGILAFGALVMALAATFFARK
jgi:hypothetical protein